MSREELLKLVADFARSNPDDAKGDDLFAVLLRMALRKEKGEMLLTNNEIIEVVHPKCFGPIVRDLGRNLMSQFGSGGQQESIAGTRAGDEDRELTPEERHLAKQRELPEGLQRGYSMLYGRFTDDHELIWAKAIKAVRKEDRTVRDSKAASYLITSGKHWLMTQIDLDNPEAFFNELVREAFRRYSEVFERIGANAYGLRGRSQTWNPELEVGALAANLGRRTFRLRDEREDREDQQSTARRARISIDLPYASDLRDLFKDAMEVAECGLTVDQAKNLARKVFNIPQAGPPLPLHEDDPEHRRRYSPEFEQPFTPEPLADESIETSAADSPERRLQIEPAVQAVIEELTRRDGISPDKRPTDTNQGREARYLLDLEIWLGSLLLPGPMTEALRARVAQKRSGEPLNHYSLSFFEAWTDIPDASVSTWRGPRRTRLLARGAIVFYGWTEAQAEAQLAVRTRRAEHYVVRLYFALRRRFLHRKPEFVSTNDSETDQNENADV
jgi:hypothetical protein